MASRRNAERRRARQRGRGRGAESPAEIPASGWKDTLWRVWQSIAEDHITLVAAGTAFFFLLAIFPALTAFVSLYGFVADPADIDNQLDAMRGMVPEAGIELIATQVTRLLEQDKSTHGVTFLIGLATALWSANAGMKSLFEAMNVAYDEDEKRGFIWRTVLTLGLTLGAMIVLVLFMVVIAVVPAVIGILGLEGALSWLVSLLRWPLFLVVAGLALAVLYRVGPSREPPQWRWVTPGSAFASVALLVASMLLSWYLSNFADYNETYGSLGAVIGLMMWLWISFEVILIGAELNAELEHQTATDTTTGRDKPLGRRDAEMADSAGRSSEARDRAA